MKIDQADLRVLALPALVALTVVLAGAATLYVTQNFLADAAAELDRAKSERGVIQTKLRQATDEEKEIRASLVDYQRMRQRGIIGEENRLDWVEALNNIRNERGIYDTRYSIEPQRPLDYPGFKKVPGIDFLDSRMKIDADLLHEEDLFNILADLRARLAPYVIGRECDLRRSTGARSDDYGPHLKVQCTLDLVTIRDSAETKK
jgi:hypothetical protein